MATKGYFIITAISSYTEYLTESEFEHAHEILLEYYTIRQRAEPFGNIEYDQTRRFIPLETGIRLLVTMSNPEPSVSEEVRGQFQWMAGLFGNIQGVIEKALSEGKLTLS